MPVFTGMTERLYIVNLMLAHMPPRPAFAVHYKKEKIRNFAQIYGFYNIASPVGPSVSKPATIIVVKTD
jgi:hypothetical protein